MHACAVLAPAVDAGFKGGATVAFLSAAGSAAGFVSGLKAVGAALAGVVEGGGSGAGDFPSPDASEGGTFHIGLSAPDGAPPT